MYEKNSSQISSSLQGAPLIQPFDILLGNHSSEQALASFKEK